MEKRREGLRVKTSAGALRQAALPGRACDPGGPESPVGHHGWEGGHSGAPEEWEELEEIELRPNGEDGRG